MDYKQANDLLQGRCKNSRKLANNTYLERYDEYLTVKLHNHKIIILYPGNTVKISSCGWQTITTKDRLRCFLPDGFYVYQKDFIWYLHNSGNGKDYDFVDGMVINLNTGEIN